ncbi:hypothetical protein MMPV_004348 [Pyropia vietnamensis]
MPPLPYGVPAPGTGVSIASYPIRLRVSASAAGLVAADGSGRPPDAFAAIYARDERSAGGGAVGGGFVHLGTTEVVEATAAPSWGYPAEVAFAFGAPVTLRVVVYDASPDSSGAGAVAAAPALLGVADTPLASLVTTPGRRMTLHLSRADEPSGEGELGSLMLGVEAVEEARQQAILRLAVSHLGAAAAEAAAKGAATAAARGEGQGWRAGGSPALVAAAVRPAVVPPTAAAAAPRRISSSRSIRSSSFVGRLAGRSSAGGNGGRPRGGPPRSVSTPSGGGIPPGQGLRPPPSLPLRPVVVLERAADGVGVNGGAPPVWTPVAAPVHVVAAYEDDERGAPAAPLHVPVLALTAGRTPPPSAEAAAGGAPPPPPPHALLRLAVYSGAPGAGAGAGAPAALTPVTLLGTVETTWPALRACADGTPLRLSPRGGVLTVMSVEVATTPSFFDWLTPGGRGLDLSLVVAVDCTVANGPRGTPHCLHRLPPGGAGDSGGSGPPANAYERVLDHVTTATAPYGSSAAVAAYGYGGAPAPGHPVSHCFPLADGNAVSPLVDGPTGVRAAYRAAVATVIPGGPPVLAEVLATAGVVASRRAAATTGSGVPYTLLTVILAAPPADVQAVKAAALRLATLPLSVILVGVGNGGNWDALARELDDGTRRPLLVGNIRAVRRAVALVRSPPGGGAAAAAAAAAAALDQLPRQVMEFCAMTGVPPPPSFPVFQGV